MKLLFAIIFLTSTAQAANFALKSELEQNKVQTVYTDETFCPSACIAIDGHDLEISELKEITEPVCKVEVAEGETCPEVEQKPTGKFHLMTNLTKKAAKAAKDKKIADEKAAAELKEKEIDDLLKKSILTNAEIIKILRARLIKQ